MSRLRGAALVAQSGGPTAVINASAAGVVEEARGQADVRAVYGANKGILGVLHEDLFDLGSESAEVIAGLRSTPSAAIGSCRFKLGDLARDRSRYQRIVDVFRAHEVRYFFYIGGNDSMDTAGKVQRLALEQDYELRVIGVPKTIDNDLTCTDHCPGFGSTAKYLATATMEAGRDTEAMHTFDAVTILEVMGRNTGWLAAATGLGRRTEADAPHLIYVPEVAFDADRFLADVRQAIKERKGEYLTVDRGRFAADAFGHRQLGGVAEYLKELIEKELGVKARYNKPGTCQRNASHFASKTDNDEAYLCGREAVRQALSGTSGMMITLVRQGNRPYRCATGLAKLEEVASGVKPLPREYLDERGTGISAAMREYVGPLIQGEAPLRLGSDGLPVFVRLERRALARRLRPFAE